MNGLPTIVVPKGRLSEQIIRLFKIIGYELPDIERTRKYFYEQFFDDADLFFAKPKAVPNLINSRICEFGFCGDDIIADCEYSSSDFSVSSIEKLCSLHLNEIEIDVASKHPDILSRRSEIKRPLIVATEFPTISNHYFTKLGIPHYTLYTGGSTEGYVDIGADCIVDVVETGETLKANGIGIIDTIMKSSTSLFAHAELSECMLPLCIQKILKLCQYKRIEIDGNDGVGKTTVCNMLKKIIPFNIKINDRGSVTDQTDKEGTFFKKERDTAYIVLDASENLSRERIEKRHKESNVEIDEKYESISALMYYRKRFREIAADNEIPVVNIVEKNPEYIANEIIKIITE